jgi:hypothetical protein
MEQLVATHPMSQSIAPINRKLIDSLAQIILSLTDDERQLLDQKIQVSQADLNTFFDELTALKPDPNQPTLEEISQVVREVRQELWTQ